jgi:uncharacterized protein
VVEHNVVDDAHEHRFEIYEGDEIAGFVEYTLRDGAIALMHTQIEPRFEGRGLGSRLARQVLDDVRRRGGSVLPFCSFIRGWIAKHPDYVDLVPEAQRSRFDL